MLACLSLFCFVRLLTSYFTCRRRRRRSLFVFVICYLLFAPKLAWLLLSLKPVML